MFYAEFVKQATDLAGITDISSPAIDPTMAGKAFSLLQTSLLALNTDDRLTFAVDDISLELSKPRLVFLRRKEGEEKSETKIDSAGIPLPDYDITIFGNGNSVSISDEEQGYYMDYAVEIPPAYVISALGKMRMVAFENYVSDYVGDSSVYAFRLEYGRAILHFRIGGTLRIGLKRPLDMPASITDEVKLTGSALNLLKYRLATELMALYGMEPNPMIDQKHSEYMQRHMKNKTEILPPPVLNAGFGRLRRL